MTAPARDAEPIRIAAQCVLNHVGQLTVHTANDDDLAIGKDGALPAQAFRVQDFNLTDCAALTFDILGQIVHHS